ncbi:hypothetical protein [Chryseobacterium sp. A301]
MITKSLTILAISASVVMLQAQSKQEKTHASKNGTSTATTSSSVSTDTSISLKANKAKGPKYRTNHRESTKVNHASLRNRGKSHSVEKRSAQNLSSATAFKEIGGREFSDEGKQLPKAVIEASKNSGYNGPVKQK